MVSGRSAKRAVSSSWSSLRRSRLTAAWTPADGGRPRPSFSSKSREAPLIDQLARLLPLEMPYTRRLLVAHAQRMDSDLRQQLRGGGDPSPVVAELSRHSPARVWRPCRPHTPGAVPHTRRLSLHLSRQRRPATYGRIRLRLSSTAAAGHPRGVRHGAAVSRNWRGVTARAASRDPGSHDRCCLRYLSRVWEIEPRHDVRPTDRPCSSQSTVSLWVRWRRDPLDEARCRKRLPGARQK